MTEETEAGGIHCQAATATGTCCQLRPATSCLSGDYRGEAYGVLGDYTCFPWELGQVRLARRGRRDGEQHKALPEVRTGGARGRGRAVVLGRECGTGNSRTRVFPRPVALSQNNGGAPAFFPCCLRVSPPTRWDAWSIFCRGGDLSQQCMC